MGPNLKTKAGVIYGDDVLEVRSSNIASMFRNRV